MRHGDKKLRFHVNRDIKASGEELQLKSQYHRWSTVKTKSACDLGEILELNMTTAAREHFGLIQPHVAVFILRNHPVLMKTIRNYPRHKG